MVRIVVYSDQPVLAKGMESLLIADPILKLSASCSKVATLKEHLANEKPDLALLDVTPEINMGILGILQTAAPACKLILWANNVAADFALQVLTIGIRGVLRKTLSLEAHRQCLHRIQAGELWFEKSLTDSFRAARRVPLTQRESQLVAMLARGLKNKEISSELGITEGTVKVYLSHLFQKSGAKDRFDLALHGLKNISMAGVPTEESGRLRSLVMESV